MTAIIHLKNGQNVTVEQFTAVHIRTIELQGMDYTQNMSDKPKYLAKEMNVFDFRHAEQCNFVGDKKVVSVFGSEILFVETISD